MGFSLDEGYGGEEKALNFLFYRSTPFSFDLCANIIWSLESLIFYSTRNRQRFEESIKVLTPSANTLPQRRHHISQYLSSHGIFHVIADRQ